MDIDTASPPVSPSVVAAILITQNSKVTSGTLLKAALAVSFKSWFCMPVFSNRLNDGGLFAYFNSPEIHGIWKFLRFRLTSHHSLGSSLLFSKRACINILGPKAMVQAVSTLGKTFDCISTASAWVECGHLVLKAVEFCNGSFSRVHRCCCTG